MESKECIIRDPTFFKRKVLRYLNLLTQMDLIYLTKLFYITYIYETYNINCNFSKYSMNKFILRVIVSGLTWAFK